MFLMCWNVAGLSTVVRRIDGNYGVKASNQKAKGNQCQAMATFLERHGSPDIVCFQEHKIPKSQLANRSEPLGCAMVEGYESFWSCCVDDKSKGMNGCVTYAKKGTVVSATSCPFGDPFLDDQGRCIMTDHGKCVVFNVYVPCSGGHPMSDKMRFLQALRRAMQQQRQQHKKAVILTGDLNLSHHKLDVHWKDLVIHVNDILQQVQDSHGNNSQQDLPTWKLQLTKAWPLIVATLKTQKAVPQQTQNSITGATFDRYRLTVTMENPTRTIFLGKPNTDEESCYYGYAFTDCCHYQDPESDEWVLSQEANVVCLYILQELMKEIAQIEWDNAVLRQIADSPDAGRSRANPPRQWLIDMMHEDEMIDTFRHLYPTARARFTCWHQYTNTRYSNEGVRIDFVVADRSLLPCLQKGGPLRTGENGNAHPDAPPEDLDPLSEEAAWAAATAKGQFQPAPFQGGGIVEPTQRVLDTQFGPRHTGIIYTPPSFSDHAAVSLLLGEPDNHEMVPNHQSWRSDDWGEMTLYEKDSNTKKAQPHKAQKSIASFFSAGSSKGGPTTSKPSLPQKRPITTVKSFFQPKGNRSLDSTLQATQTKPSMGNSQILKVGGSSVRKKRKTAPSILNHFARK